jgi:hypothetical protein
MDIGSRTYVRAALPDTEDRGTRDTTAGGPSAERETQSQTRGTPQVRPTPGRKRRRELTGSGHRGTGGRRPWAPRRRWWWWPVQRSDGRKARFFPSLPRFRGTSLLFPPPAERSEGRHRPAPHRAAVHKPSSLRAGPHDSRQARRAGQATHRLCFDAAFFFFFFSFLTDDDEGTDKMYYELIIMPVGNRRPMCPGKGLPYCT